MDELTKKLSKKLKDIRISKGLDQQTLAQRTGVGRSYISLIENGKKTAAVSTLALIADALGVGVGEFFEDTRNFRDPKLSLNKNTGSKPTAGKTSYGYTYTPLSIEKRNKIMDPFLVRIEPDNKQKYCFSHKGEEFNFILQGKLKLTYEDQEIILESGDSVYFDSSIPHKLDLIGDETVYMLSVNTTAVKDLKGK